VSVQAVLHALGEPRRREILRLTWSRELAAGAIHQAIGGVTFGAVSQHLRVLADAGLVEARRDGRHRFYRARPDQLGHLRAWLETMWARSLDDLAELAEAEDRSRAPARPRRGARR
jgi:DNA-binding transcriptional ArsR family regulator